LLRPRPRPGFGRQRHLTDGEPEPVPHTVKVNEPIECAPAVVAAFIGTHCELSSSAGDARCALMRLGSRL
jgi:hypothetical protein